MKLNVGDAVTLSVSGVKLNALVEDASKSDIIMAKVTGASGASAYAIDKVYEFPRQAIEGA